MPNDKRPGPSRLADLLVTMLVAGGLAVIALAGDTTDLTEGPSKGARTQSGSPSADHAPRTDDNDVARATTVRMTAGR
jgi:hypothetical protein